LSFVKKMLKWKPEERSSAKELLGDPWLNCWLHKVLMIN
jgi:serine/threonine protein kinase